METRGRRGQASIEFVVTLGVILIILIMTGYVIFQRYVRTTDLKIYISGKRIADSLADNINTMNSVGDGYSMTVTLPYRMFSTKGYDVRFYGDEPTVFVRGGAFTISRPIYFSSPISTNRVLCLMSECNNRCNESETDACLQVNRTMNVRIVNHMNRIYLTPEHNIEQPGLAAEIKAFNGHDVREDFVVLADNITGYRSMMYVYLDGERKAYLVLNHNSTGVVEMYFNDTVGDLSVVESYGVGELDFANNPQGRWVATGGEYKGGIILLGSGGVHACITSSIPAGRFVWVNRGYEQIDLQSSSQVCITYP